MLGISSQVFGNTTSLPAALDVVGADDDDAGLSCIIAAAAADCCCCCVCTISCCLAFLPLSRPALPARSFMLLDTALTATCRQIHAGKCSRTTLSRPRPLAVSTVNRNRISVKSGFRLRVRIPFDHSNHTTATFSLWIHLD